VPYSAINGRKTGTNLPNKSTWTTYEQAKAYKGEFDGLGFVLTGVDGLGFIDIDGDREKGELNPLQSEIIELFKLTYIEKSPSGLGLHIVFKYDKNKIKKDKAKYFEKNTTLQLEFYIDESTRYLTVTEGKINENAVIDQTEQVLTFLEKYMVRGHIKYYETHKTGTSDGYVHLSTLKAEKVKYC
jgi:putative DNA primase/helicase